MLVISTLTTAAKAEDTTASDSPSTQGSSPSTDPTPQHSSTQTTVTTQKPVVTTSGVPSMSAPLSVLATVMMMKQLL